jgi:large subunit ribosomal protein L18
MSRWKNKEERRRRRHYRIRNKITGTSERPRLVVFRSLNHIYAQIVDDSAGRTLVSASTALPDLKDKLAGAKGKTEQSKLVGAALAEKAKSAGIGRVSFDRAGYLYHGRVKALAEGAREGGLEF